ncbi:MAG: glycogen/starch/alpha-glucan phosphorylase [Bacilli bacterium]|jgi:starch phosphorylase|nr:glycogen/starch/alpha-glucan phosphorylase [Bacilli bacterium]MDD3388796.1 glycogen/starch/alpha-glucan phosphorylase [Bacilli bacterium]MDD4344586.1 glycogen/starch/alpha-glucan phosphorylase [Bacilli bacterium]MDD4520480.1 glycogen/starch/alpha-glucan phosphorylase [Bacilli bacterium]MDY0399105.1 glycogen/starch/alpha-glucan phosphorylase [Bacilli bacterium]
MNASTQKMFVSPKEFKLEFVKRLSEKYGRSVKDSHITERYDVLGRMVRDYAAINWRETREKILNEERKQLIYFSMEFLIGRLLVNNMMNLGIYDVARSGFAEMGIDINELEDQESDAGLGNGGLGRLAACFIDSLASLSLPGHGNCIRYEYGFFRQKIVDGRQIEVPDQWLVNGNVWEVRKPKHSVEVKFYGHAETYMKPNGTYGIRTADPVCVKAVPYDMSIIGYQNGVANTLRLWSAEPSEENLPRDQKFEDYLVTLKELCHGLYPDDSTEHGRILRLRQQYFLVSAGLQSAVRGHFRRYKTLKNFKEKFVFQLNDTHPILAIPELMRILMDDYSFGWDDAWEQVTGAMAYTNHTVMPEALEKWPVMYIQQLIPRCYMIIEEINRRSQIYFNDSHVASEAKRNMAIIKEGMIHMTNLALYTVFSVNGVAAIHTQILKDLTFPDYYSLMPNKFNNKTNGITHRRWFLYANPNLASLVSDKIGEGWIRDPDQLEKFAAFKNDADVQKRFMKIKKANKVAFAAMMKKTQGIDVNIDSIFDVQIKRLHAYKRQLMNLFRIMHLYHRAKTDPNFSMYPHTYIFGAKAAPSYFFAKKVIELINAVASTINHDPAVSKFMQVVFVENYNVSKAEVIIPAADISEQISTAGKEASGTSNMKFMMNGALTLGTLDGANVEIAERVGPEHCFIFGLKADQVIEKRNSGYNPWDVYNRDSDVHWIIDSLINGTWNNGAIDQFRAIFDEVMYRGDEYLILEDLQAYVSASEKIDEYYQSPKKWIATCVVNMAMSGYFSTDRTIHQYNDEIWHLDPL